MALYDITHLGTPGSVDPGLVKLARTKFSAHSIHERTHLQAALRDQIEVLDDQLFVVSEEFGAFEGVSRRIDLLCVDKNCRLVVVELKRTADGGHMELQALRYAAMVSTMTFDQLVIALTTYRKARDMSDPSAATARADLLTWLDADDDDEPEIPRDVGIVLASEDFSNEIATTVLWLNEFHGFDFRCVRLRPYVLADRLLLDVQQVIPLPEASSYTVRVREKENAERQAKASPNADWTKFVITKPTGRTEPLPKRWAMLRLVEGLIEAGVPMQTISTILPPSKTLLVKGHYASADELWMAIKVQHGRADENRRRWHLDNPLQDDADTWVLNNNWGNQTRAFFAALLKVAPPGFAVDEEGAASTSTSIDPGVES